MIDVILDPEWERGGNPKRDVRLSEGWQGSVADSRLMIPTVQCSNGTVGLIEFGQNCCLGLQILEESFFLPLLQEISSGMTGREDR